MQPKTYGLILLLLFVTYCGISVYHTAVYSDDPLLASYAKDLYIPINILTFLCFWPIVHFMYRIERKKLIIVLAVGLILIWTPSTTIKIYEKFRWNSHYNQTFSTESLNEILYNHRFTSTRNVQVSIKHHHVYYEADFVSKGGDHVTDSIVNLLLWDCMRLSKYDKLHKATYIFKHDGKLFVLENFPLKNKEGNPFESGDNRDLEKKIRIMLAIRSGQEPHSL